MAAVVQQEPDAQWMRLKSRASRSAFVVGGLASETDVPGWLCWKLHPVFASWLWPLLIPATELALYVPSDLLEIARSPGLVPQRPTEAQKDAVLKLPDLAEEQIRVYRLVLKGKPPSVHKAFPTRTCSRAALHYCERFARADEAAAERAAPRKRTSA